MAKLSGMIGGAVLAAFLATGSGTVVAASLPLVQGPLDPGNQLGNLNSVVQSVNSNVPGFGSTFAGKNYLDNGAIFVTQRGTSAATGGTTSGCPVTAYSADRWCIDTNVASGAGNGAIITTAPVPPAFFQNMQSVYRNAGALTQPVCLLQEIETARFIQVAGKNVILSAWIGSLAGAPSGMTVTGYLFTGTGTDQGLGTMTASPAITPAFTGIATNGITLSATSIPASTAAPARYSSGLMAVPAAATEGAVAFCFTPGAETAGTTDGFAIAGIQLEQADPNQTSASAFEQLALGIDLMRSQRFYWQLNEPILNAVVGMCQATGAATQSCIINLPQQMRKAPALAITTGTFKENIAGTATTWVTPTAGTNTVNAIGINTANTTTAGQALLLTGGGGTGIVTASADF